MLFSPANIRLRESVRWIFPLGQGLGSFLQVPVNMHHPIEPSNCRSISLRFTGKNTKYRDWTGHVSRFWFQEMRRIGEKACLEHGKTIVTDYKDSTTTSVQRKMECRDAQCRVTSHREKQSVTLSQAQKEEILSALKAEASLATATDTSMPGDWQLRIKARYQNDRVRLEITRNLPEGEFDRVSPQLAGVIKTYLGQDVAGQAAAEPTPPASEEKTDEPPSQ